MEEKSEHSQVYEIGYHIVSSIAEENVPKEVETVKALLSDVKAEIIAEDAPKLTNLAYSISKATGGLRRKFDKAYFGWIKFELETEAVPGLKKKLDGLENVLRYLLIKTVHENTLYGGKLVTVEDTTKKKPMKVKEEKVTTATVEEIDKSIDDLIKE